MTKPHNWFDFFCRSCKFFFNYSYVAVDGLCTMLVDLKPEWFYKSKIRRPIFVACVCMTHFIVSLPMLTKGGIYVFQLFDKFAASGLTLLWVAIFQTVVISWVYGTDNYYNNLHQMFGHKMKIKTGPWRILGYVLWKYVTPLVCTTVFIYYLIAWKQTVYDQTYVYPMWGEILGLCLGLSSMLAIPGHFVYAYVTAKGETFKQRWIEITTPQYSSVHPYTTGDVKQPTIDEYNDETLTTPE